MRLALPRPRRHRPATAASAYALASVVTRDEGVATDIAVEALTSAGGQLAVLAKVRSLALAHANRSKLAGAADQVVSKDLRTFARQLAMTQSPEDVADVDLATRYGLDARSFARVLGTDTKRAARRDEELLERWAATLDPAMLAWLGPGSCDDLARLLVGDEVWPRATDFPLVGSIDTTGPVPIVPATDPGPQATGELTVAALLAAAPTVSRHSEGCEVCGQRMSALTSVRTLLGQAPIGDIPEAVRGAAAERTRHDRRDVGTTIARRRAIVRHDRMTVVTISVVLAAVVGYAGTRAFQDHGTSRSHRVQQLIQSTPASPLIASPTMVTHHERTITLTNVSNAPTRWTALADVPWAVILPASGSLEGGASATLEVDLPSTGSFGEGTITFTTPAGTALHVGVDPDI